MVPLFVFVAGMGAFFMDQNSIVMLKLEGNEDIGMVVKECTTAYSPLKDE